jgi:hypothetical protein
MTDNQGHSSDSKEEDLLTSVARTIGSTLGTVAAKVSAVGGAAKPARKKAASRKRRPTAKKTGASKKTSSRRKTISKPKNRKRLEDN